MHRFYLPPADWDISPLTLPADEANHCARILRLTAGTQIEIFDGCGRHATATIIATDRRRVTIAVCTIQPPPSLRAGIHLAQSIPKGKNMELVIQKATELGVACITPLISERVVAAPSPNDTEKKRAKWQRIAIEACKQCGQNYLPKINPPTALDDFLNSEKKSQLPLVASLENDSLPLKKILATHEQPPATATVLIGPEGDFSATEYAAIRTAGYQPLNLGNITLRTETAAIYAIAIIGHELQG